VHSVKVFCTALMRLDGAVEHREVTVGIDVCRSQRIVVILCQNPGQPIGPVFKGLVQDSRCVTAQKSEVLIFVAAEA
jgi:hypothetical protein